MGGCTDRLGGGCSPQVTGDSDVDGGDGEGERGQQVSLRSEFSVSGFRDHEFRGNYVPSNRQITKHALPFFLNLLSKIRHQLLVLTSAQAKGIPGSVRNVVGGRFVSISV